MLNAIKKALRKIFCHHNYEVIYSLKVNGGMNRLRVYQCTKCRKQIREIE